MYKICSSLFLLLILASCIESFDYNTDSYENALIVQGIITTNSEECEVKLNRSANLDSSSFINVIDAIVFVTDRNGNIEMFEEIEGGKYKPTNINFKGEIGNEYVLSIITSDNKEYESEPVTLINVPEIDSVDFSYKEIFDYNTGLYIKGINVNINTEWDENCEHYFRWVYELTVRNKTYYDVINHPIPYDPCFYTEYSDMIIIDDTKNFSSNKLIHYPIIYLNEYNTEPYYGCSFLIKQYSINKSVYSFWEMVKKNIEETGSVFDNVPYSPISNIKCCSKDEGKVYGFFDASSVTEKRVFLKSPVLDVEFRNIYDNCSSIEISYAEAVEYELDELYIIESFGSIKYTPFIRCVDCMYVHENSTRDVPDFWTYK